MANNSDTEDYRCPSCGQQETVVTNGEFRLTHKAKDGEDHGIWQQWMAHSCTNCDTEFAVMIAQQPWDEFGGNDV